MTETAQRPAAPISSGLSDAEKQALDMARDLRDRVRRERETVRRLRDYLYSRDR